MKQRISIDQLKPGMYVTAIKNVSWLKHPFIRNKRLIKNEDEVQALKDCGGCEVYIDTAIGDDLDGLYSASRPVAMKRRPRS